MYDYSGYRTSLVTTVSVGTRCLDALRQKPEKRSNKPLKEPDLSTGF